MSDNRIIELEDENKSLSAKLVSILEHRIEELEAEILELKAQLASRPISLMPTAYPKPKIRTVNELVKLMELRSIRGVE